MILDLGTRWKGLLILPCAWLSLAAGAPSQVDATKLTCAQFAELGQSVQRRILSFLQGYEHREVPEAKVGSVPIGAGLARVLDACRAEPSEIVWKKVHAVAPGRHAVARGEARVTRPPTEITCKVFLKLDRDDQRLTVTWLDGYSRKPDPSDANQSVVALDRDPEVFAQSACGKRKQRLWWAIQGSVRSVDPPPAN
jgi:hypothetical protein